MSSIAHQQNSDNNLRLLCAQSYIYSKAKQLRLWHTNFVVILATLSAIFIFLPDEFKNIIAIVGIVVTLVGAFMEHFESSQIKQAAKIQEEFDTNLFTLSWNKILAGNKVEPEIIRIANRNFNGDREKMIDWYPDPKPLPYPFDVLVCQRANLVWDSALHSVYAYLLLVASILWIVIGISIAYLSHQTVYAFFLAWILPSLPALYIGIQLTFSHFDIAKEKKELREQLNSLWEQGLKEPSSITKTDCREIQNCIFSLRCKNALVPDFIYRYLRNRYEIDMRNGANDLRKAAIKVLGLNKKK